MQFAVTNVIMRHSVSLSSVYHEAELCKISEQVKILFGYRL